MARVAHSRGVLGAEPTATASPGSPLDDALASFGAAIAANDETAIAARFAAAQAAGATHAQLEQAVATAAKVQESAARIHLRAAERLVAKASEEPGGPASEPEAKPNAEAENEKCGCEESLPGHGEDGTDAAGDMERQKATMSGG